MTTKEFFFLSEQDAIGTPDARITWFTSATATTPKTVGSLQGFIAECRGENYKAAVLAIRQAAAAGDKNKAGLLKRKLPAVTLSCAMISRAKAAPERVRTHSGWLQCDFDAQENPDLVQSEIRARLQADPHVGAVFCGPSGAGIKAALRIDGSRHRESFDLAADYFKAEYGLTIDQSAKDVERLCFVSHDPDAWCRETESQALPITADEPAVAVAKTPFTRSNAAGRTICHAPFSAADVAELLSYIKPPGDGPNEYDHWLRVLSAAGNTLSHSDALAVLLRWSPDRRPGETAHKLQNRLETVRTGTLVRLAQAGGYRGGLRDPEDKPTTKPDDGACLKPQPFARPKLQAVLPYRQELLPPGLRDWVQDIVTRSTFQTDFVVVTVLTTLGICIGSKAAVFPKRRDDWCEFPNIWSMIVGRPSQMKSPAMGAALAPIRSVASRWAEDYQRELAEFMEKQAHAEIKHKAALKQVRKAAEKGQDFEVPKNQREAPPRDRRVSTSDTTKEKLASLMQENPAGILCEYDELFSLFNAIEADPGLKEFLLKCWGGKAPHHVDRITRGSQFVPKACASVIGGVQPGRLRPLVAAGLSGGEGSDGFLPRFQLVAWPDLPTGEFELVDEWPDTAAKRRAQALFDELADMDALDFPCQNGSDTHGLRFDDAAQDRFYRWLCDLENHLRSDREPDAMAELLGKNKKLVPALALLLQLGRDPRSQSIDLEALENAIEFSRIAETHQRRLYDCASDDLHVAAAIWEKALDESLNPEGFSANDVCRPCWSGLTDRKLVKSAMDSLEDKKWLLRVDAVGPVVGRPSTRYRVNPAARDVAFFV
jgi:hypothetical protein